MGPADIVFQTAATALSIRCRNSSAPHIPHAHLLQDFLLNTAEVFILTHKFKKFIDVTV